MGPRDIRTSPGSSGTTGSTIRITLGFRLLCYQAAPASLRESRPSPHCSHSFDLAIPPQYLRTSTLEPDSTGSICHLRKWDSQRIFAHILEIFWTQTLFHLNVKWWPCPSNQGPKHPQALPSSCSSLLQLVNPNTDLSWRMISHSTHEKTEI